jgi:hypothetical protein
LPYTVYALRASRKVWLSKYKLMREPRVLLDALEPFKVPFVVRGNVEVFEDVGPLFTREIMRFIRKGE